MYHPIKEERLIFLTGGYEFNINIEEIIYIGINNANITNLYPYISYIKVKTPKIELIISSEPS